jgi:hypothetical protein
MFIIFRLVKKFGDKQPRSVNKIVNKLLTEGKYELYLLGYGDGDGARALQ